MSSADTYADVANCLIIGPPMRVLYERITPGLRRWFLCFWRF
jgi:hypothetical protein